MKLVIEKKAFELKFGFKCFMLLGEKLGLQTFNQVVEKFSAFGDNTDVSFEQMQLLEYLVEAAIDANNANSQLEYSYTDVSIIDYLMANQNQLNKVMEAFSNSFPKDQGKQKAQPKTRKKTT